MEEFDIIEHKIDNKSLSKASVKKYTLKTVLEKKIITFKVDFYIQVVKHLGTAFHNLLLVLEDALH